MTGKFRCSRGHEYAGEAFVLTIEIKGAMVRAVNLCPYCVLALAQTVETQLVEVVEPKP